MTENHNGNIVLCLPVKVNNTSLIRAYIHTISVFLLYRIKLRHVNMSWVTKAQSKKPLMKNPDSVIWNTVRLHVQRTVVSLPDCTTGSIDLLQPGSRLLLIVYRHILFLLTVLGFIVDTHLHSEWLVVFLMSGKAVLIETAVWIVHIL